MATHQAKSISIRRRDDDDEPNQDQQPPKIQRLESSGESAAPPTKIIDLNDDCLMKIFGHFDLDDLFSVAVANEWLRPAAAEIYKRKFGVKWVRVNECNDHQRNTRANARKNHNEKEKSLALKQYRSSTVVRGLKTCLQFLRCFGAAINNLTIDFGKSRSKRYQYVLEQMNKFCAQSLVYVSFYEMADMAIKQQFQKVFSKVTTVRFSGGSLGQQWPSIGECFPKLEKLEFFGVSMNGQKTDGSLIEKPFEHLKHVRIDGHLNGNNTSKTLTNFLEMAQQLDTLEIRSAGNIGMPMNALLNHMKQNPSITKLFVRLPFDVFFPANSDEVRQLISQHPALIELDFQGYRFNADDATAVVRGLNSLKKFQFQMLHADYTRFVQQLDAKWKAKNDDWGHQYLVELEC